MKFKKNRWNFCLPSAKTSSMVTVTRPTVKTLPTKLLFVSLLDELWCDDNDSSFSFLSNFEKIFFIFTSVAYSGAVDDDDDVNEEKSSQAKTLANTYQLTNAADSSGVGRRRVLKRKKDFRFHFCQFVFLLYFSFAFKALLNTK